MNVKLAHDSAQVLAERRQQRQRMASVKVIILACDTRERGVSRAKSIPTEPFIPPLMKIIL